MVGTSLVPRLLALEAGSLSHVVSHVIVNIMGTMISHITLRP